MPLVSIVLTSYSHAKFIREAIDSVINQTFSNWELFIFDDASPDDSWNIIKSYVDPRIKVFRNSVNQGPIYAFNKVIFELALGKYIAIHHSDDVWELHKLQKQVDFLEENRGIGAVFSNASVIDERGAPLADPAHFYYSIFNQPNRSRHEWLRYFFFNGNALCHPSILIRKQCYEDCGPYLDMLAQLPDWDMWVRLCTKHEIHVMADRLIQFRVRDAEMNTSGNRPETRTRGAYEYYKVLQRYRTIVGDDEVFKIFPDFISYDRGENTDPEYVLARICLESETFFLRYLLGIEILFDIINNSLRRQAAEKTYHFSLNDFIAITGRHNIFSHDRFIPPLVTKADRNSLIANLNQTIVERDGQIAKLNQAVAERDGKMAILQQRQNELRMLYNELRNENVTYRLSTSWRVTRPLRQVSQWWQRVMRFIRRYQSYRQAYPGVSGFRRLVRLCVNIIRKGGIGLLISVALHEQSRSAALQPSSGSVLVLDDIADRTVELPKDVAVHAHIYYADLATEIRSYLENIPVKFHFYVTTDTLEKAKLIEDAFSNMKNILAFDIRITENRGRDIFPMLVALGDKLSQHEIVLHIHTKRSPHNVWELRGWRRYLMESLLGNPQRVTAILQQFVQNKNLGILFPDPYHPVKRLVQLRTNANDQNFEKLLGRAGKKKAELGNINTTFFPAGDMFWFRGEAIKSFVNMKLSEQDFEPEEGQSDATLAHAVERMFPYFANEMGLITKSYFSNAFLSQQCSAHRIDLFNTYLEKGLIVNPTILFDHNGGGGTNIYTHELVKIILAEGGTVLRVYCFDAIWFVQWIGDGDGMLFYASSIDELFEILSVSRSASIVLNSLYGYPDIKVAASNIIGLAQTLSATLDFKIHDFYALCPSPHLSDFEGKYCGVPQDLAVCSDCLKKNLGWYHSWYPEENRPIDIAEWRKPFTELFEAANTVTFFDQSSVEIARKAFYLGDSKVKVIPHVINYFICDSRVDVTGPLHIGILGTLSPTKGGKVVRALYDYIEEQGMHIPITVVGPSLVDTPPGINVLGNYTPNDLPIIVSQQGINVILMPSIVPETFSYTISEAMEMGLPIVAFDIGAQGNRVKQYVLGKVVPLGSSPEVILQAIQSVLKTAQVLKQ